MTFGFTVSAHATLIDRGGGLIYDDDLNITWLKDANYGIAPMGWRDAITWANNLTYQGYNDWRLPSAVNRNGDIRFCYDGLNCKDSEFGHLYYIELGNPAGGPLNNSGPFSNIQNVYWTSSQFDPLPTMYAWTFSFTNDPDSNMTTTPGYQDIEPYNDERYTSLWYAWAVRDGDVSSVPEPCTLLLLGSGLAWVVVLRRKLKVYL